MLVQSLLPDSFSQSEHPVTMIFWGPSNAFMRREPKNTALRPANVLRMTFHNLFPHF